MKVVQSSQPAAHIWSAADGVRTARIELIINLKDAKVLGLDKPLQLQQLADEIIE
jgi:hypothetical protein